MDVVGNDIACNPLGTNSPGDLAKLCQTTSGCVAFNVFQPLGGVPTFCLKTARTPLSDQSTTWMKGTCQGFYTGANRRASYWGRYGEQLTRHGIATLLCSPRAPPLGLKPTGGALPLDCR